MYIRRYSTQHSLRALRILFPPKKSCCVFVVFSLAWYEIVMRHFLVVYHGISHLSLVFSHTIEHSRLRGYTDKIQGIFHGIPLESVVELVYSQDNHVISLPEFFSNTNPRWPVIVALSNFSGGMLTETI